MSKRESKSVILDSSIWISSLLNNDKFHYESMRKIVSYTKRKFTILIPLPVVLEIITVMHRNGFKNQEIEEFVQSLNFTSHYEIVEIGKEKLIQSAIHSFPKINLRSPDYHIILYAIEYKSTVFETIDNTQKTAYNLIKSKLSI